VLLRGSVLRDLLTLWRAEEFIVIGAAAIACHLDLRWRQTFDLDLSVASRPETYGDDLERLGWRRERGSLQRWIAPDGSLVDVLPAHPSLVEKGEFTWPDDGARLTLVGFRLAFADAVTTEIAPGVCVRVASLRSLVVLKMAAYLDRPWERDSDLSDLAHILPDFVGPDARERWSDDVIELGLAFEDVSPFVLGTQLGALVDDAERGLVRRFLSAIDDPADPLATLPRMVRFAPSGSNHPERLGLRLNAFRRGFESQGG
jgi:predicted nucleotidyltransferase